MRRHAPARGASPPGRRGRTSSQGSFLVPAGEDLKSLTDAQWRELEDCAERLERTLLHKPEHVDLLLFLPPPGAPHRRLVLIELIKTELEALHRRGAGLT